MQIYVNARIKDGTPTAQLMTIFTENEAYDHEQFPATSKRKQHFKEDEKGVSEMCDIMREVKEEGIAEGMERGKMVGIAEGIEQTIVQMYREGIIEEKLACEKLDCTPEKFAECVAKYTE